MALRRQCEEIKMYVIVKKKILFKTPHYIVQNCTLYKLYLCFLVILETTTHWYNLEHGHEIPKHCFYDEKYNHDIKIHGDENFCLFKSRTVNIVFYLSKFEALNITKYSR